MIELFLLIYLEVLICVSRSVLLFPFEIWLPRCLILSTQGSGVPHNKRLGNSLGLLMNAMSLVLHLTGFGSVENLRL